MALEGPLAYVMVKEFMRIRARRKNAVLLLAWLALAGMFFQVLAFDHHVRFGSSDSHILGVHGSSEHALHCHGESGNCSQGSSASLAFVLQPVLSLPPVLLEQVLDAGASGASTYLLPTTTPPPQNRA